MSKSYKQGTRIVMDYGTMQDLGMNDFKKKRRKSTQ